MVNPNRTLLGLLLDILAGLLGQRRNYRRFKPFVVGTRGRSVDPHVRQAVMASAGNKCLKCGSTNDLQVDHVIPHSWGGGNHYGNLQCLCRSCNAAKSNHTAADYR